MSKMEEHLKNVFSSSETPQLYHEILENSDFENLLLEQHVHPAVRSPEVPKLESKAFKIPTIPRKIQKKNTVAIKVKSLGKIRKTFETEQTEKLQEILKQNENLINLCLKHKTGRERLIYKSLIESLLKKEQPLSRASLKRLTQFNLHDFKHIQQSIRVNGKPVLLSGGLGGNVPEVDYDTLGLNPNKVTSRRSSDNVRSPNKDQAGAQLSQMGNTKHRGILACSNITFKPGPLSKKPVLSTSSSHTIHGPLELMRVPAVGLEVFPRVGMKLDTAACFHLGNVRRRDGRINADWAQFAASLVEQPATADTKQSHTFILPYENNQSRILMQKDLDFTEKFISKSGNHNLTPIKDFICLDELTNINTVQISGKIEIAVKNILSDLINTVAIGEVQDRIWKYDEDYKPVEVQRTDTKTEKKKATKRKYNELRRLDVTVIDVDNGKTQGEEETCNKLSCKLGCVCSSLRSCFLMNEHCGKAECMFKCSCKLEVSKSAVVNLQNQLNRHLCKEEQKFKRTVIRSNDETLVLGASRRGLRVPKKFEDFYFENQLDAKLNTTSQKDVKILCNKLPSDLNLAPWCMVHQLYTCFCKGLFTEGSEFKYSYASEINDNSSENITIIHIDDDDPDDNASEETPDTFCSRRTIYNEQFIKRSKKCGYKYLERNCRIKWLERENTGKMRILNSHIDNAFKLFNEGKDPIIVVAEPSSKPERKKRKSTSTEDSLSLPNTSDFSNPTSNNIVRNWSKLIEDYCNRKMFVWATKQPPLKIYITSTFNIFSKSVCIPIPVGEIVDETLLNSHNPMLREIVNKNVSAHKQVLLTRKAHAWELCGSAIKENNPKIIPKQSSLGAPEPIGIVTSKHLFTWPKIPETPKKISGDLETENTDTSNETGKKPEVVPAQVNQNKSRVKSITLKSSRKLIKKIKFSSKDSVSVNSKPASVSHKGSHHENEDSILSSSKTGPLLENSSLESNKIKSQLLTHEMKTASLVPKKLDSSLVTLKEKITTALIPEWGEKDSLKPNPDNTCSIKLTSKHTSPLIHEERDTPSQIPEKVIVVSKPKENTSVISDQKKSSSRSEKQDSLLIPDKSETTSMPKQADQTSTACETKGVKENSNRPPLPKLSIPTLKISANQLIKLPNTVTGPLVTNDPKYRWLLLHLEDDLTGMTVIYKKFAITRLEVIEAMSLAEKSGKTCKFPVSQGSPQSSVPGFGIYAVPGNRMKEIFLGPYRHDEKMGLKILVRKNLNTGKRTWGKWTKTLNKANVIVCDRDKDVINSASDSATKHSTNSSDNSHKVNTVVVIDPSSTLNISKIPIDLPDGRSLLRKAKIYPKCSPNPDLPVRDTQKNIFGKETVTVNPVNPTSMLSKASLENISNIFKKKLTTLKSLTAPPPEKDLVPSTPGDEDKPSDRTAGCSPEKEDKESTDGEEDDVIFLPTKTDIVEVLDSDEEETPISPTPSQVWFLCTNIPPIGYIAATQKPNGSIVLKFDHLGPIECSNPTTAMVSINM